MSHIEYLEGRRYAIELLMSISGSSPASPDRAQLIAEVIENLNRTTLNQPLAYANGIYSILSKLPTEQNNG